MCVCVYACNYWKFYFKGKKKEIFLFFPVLLENLIVSRICHDRNNTVDKLEKRRNGGREIWNQDRLSRSCHEVITLVTLVQPSLRKRARRKRDEYLRSMRIGDPTIYPSILISVSFNGSRTETRIKKRSKKLARIFSSFYPRANFFLRSFPLDEPRFRILSHLNTMTFSFAQQWRLMKSTTMMLIIIWVLTLPETIFAILEEVATKAERTNCYWNCNST